MVDVNIGYDGLHRAGAQLKSGQAEMGEKLKSLKSMIDQLVTGEFRTQLASGKFQDSYQQWTTGAQNMLTGLEGMGEFLNQVVREHQELDNKLAGGAAR
jgi:uncharacterized protein YukE